MAPLRGKLPAIPYLNGDYLVGRNGALAIQALSRNTAQAAEVEGSFGDIPRMFASERSISPAPETMTAMMDGSWNRVVRLEPVLKGINMETQANKSPHTLFWIAGIAVTVFSAAGIAAIMGWIPTSTSSPSESIAVAKQPAAQAKPVARAHTTPVQMASKTSASAKCAECGMVELVREIETKGEGSGIGAVGGAVVGGVLGHQVGSGRGQDAATVVGAVGGAVAGHQIEKHVKSTKSYEITVRFENGSSRVINEANATSWRVGDRVKVVNGAIQSNA